MIAACVASCKSSNCLNVSSFWPVLQMVVYALGPSHARPGANRMCVRRDAWDRSLRWGPKEVGQTPRRVLEEVRRIALFDIATIFEGRLAPDLRVNVRRGGRTP